MRSPMEHQEYVRERTEMIREAADKIEDTRIKDSLFLIRQKINVAAEAKNKNQMGLYKYSIESAEKMLKELETITNK